MLALPIDAFAIDVPVVTKYAQGVEIHDPGAFDSPVPACAWVVRASSHDVCRPSDPLPESEADSPEWAPCEPCGGHLECSFHYKLWENGCTFPPDDFRGPAQNIVYPVLVCPTPFTLVFNYDINGNPINYRCNGPDDFTPPLKCPLIAHPVQVTTGQKVWVETDFDKPFNFRRVYTTRDATGFVRGGFGPQWTHSYDRHLYLTDTVTQVWSVRADGTLVLFTNNGSGTWSPSDGSSLRMVTQGTGFLLTNDDDEQETYDGTGLLTSVRTRDGRVFTLAYDPISSLLVSITNDQGRSLTFGVDAGSYGTRYTSVTDSAGVQIQYQYATTPPAPDDNKNQLVGISWLDTGGVTRQRTYFYEVASHRTLLTGIQDERGQRISTYTYDSSNRVLSSSLWGDATHAVSSYGFTYTSPTQTDVTTPLGSTSYTFALLAGAQRMTGSTQPCASCGASAQTMGYDAAGYPSSTTDFNGNITLSTYDDVRGLELSRTEASNDPAPPATSAKRTIATTWHPTFRVPTVRTTTNASGAMEAQSTWTYNTRGQALSRCEADPAVSGATTYTCGSSTNAPAGVRQWTYTYCDSIGPSCPLIGLMLTSNGPRATTDAGMGGVDDKTTYAYYTTDDSTCASGGTCPHRLGDLWKVTNALSQVTTYASYDKNGRVTRIQDPNNTATDFLYHPRGWLTDRIVRASMISSGAMDATTHIDYDPAGNVVKVTQPDGAFLAYTYDTAKRLLKITDNANDIIDYCPGGIGTTACLDAAGNRTVEQTRVGTNAASRTIGRTFDSMSRLTSVLNSLGTAVVSYPSAGGYDGNGNPTQSVDGLGFHTQQTYDGLNRLVSTIQNAGGIDTATQNTTTGYRYDTRDNLRQVTDPDLLNTVYTYDGLNNLTGLSSPDTGLTSYVPDKAGNRISQTDNRGITSTYTYDALNRLTAIAYPTTSLNVTYAYDQSNATTGCSTSNPIGRLTKMTDGSGSTTYCYDRRGNVLQKKQVTNGLTLTTSYTYTLADRLATMTYPSGDLVTYGRDALGRITTASVKIGTTTTPLVSNATYYPFGPLNALTWGNGRTLTKTYDQDYAIDQIASSAATGLKLDLGVDVMGDITQASATLGATPPDRQYAYDPLYRLTTAMTGATPPGPLEAYTYDKTGDRLSASLNGAAAQPYTYTPATHQLHSVNGINRGYDPNGNTQTGIGSAILGYDDKDRLATATIGSITATYQTNGRGERVKKVTTGTGAATTEYVYDESDTLIGEYGSTGTAQVEYIAMDGIPIAIVKGTSVAYVETDHLGTPRQVVNPTTNAALWIWDFLASTFGTAAPNQNPSGSGIYVLNTRFPGQYYDTETGLNYNVQRDYDQGTGRYIESDPVGLGGGISTFGYVFNNALLYTDRTGLLIDGGGLGRALARGAAVDAAGGGPLDPVGDACAIIVVGVTLADEIARSANQSEVHRICDEPPPANLNPCELARWKLTKALRCKLVRERMSTKWFGGGYDTGHAMRMAELATEIENLRKAIDRECKPCPSCKDTK